MLKDDAANGGEAFAQMLLDLHGVTLAQIREVKEEIKEEVKQELRKIATGGDVCRALQSVESGMRQDLGEIKGMLRQLLQRSQPESRATLLPSLGAVDTVPKLPPHFLPRPEDLQELKGRLLAPATQTVVMTGQPRQVGLQGMGGIGKTVLAAGGGAGCGGAATVSAWVVWLTVGIQPKPIELYQRVATTLGRVTPIRRGMLSGMLICRICCGKNLACWCWMMFGSRGKRAFCRDFGRRLSLVADY